MAKFMEGTAALPWHVIPGAGARPYITVEGLDRESDYAREGRLANEIGPEFDPGVYRQQMAELGKHAYIDLPDETAEGLKAPDGYTDGLAELYDENPVPVRKRGALRRVGMLLYIPVIAASLFLAIPNKAQGFWEEGVAPIMWDYVNNSDIIETEYIIWREDTMEVVAQGSVPYPQNWENIKGLPIDYDVLRAAVRYKFMDDQGGTDYTGWSNEPRFLPKVIGDVAEDYGIVEPDDGDAIFSHIGTVPGDPNWNQVYDVNATDEVNVWDWYYYYINLGLTYRYPMTDNENTDRQME